MLSEPSNHQILDNNSFSNSERWRFEPIDPLVIPGAGALTFLDLSLYPQYTRIGTPTNQHSKNQAIREREYPRTNELYRYTMKWFCESLTLYRNMDYS